MMTATTTTTTVLFTTLLHYAWKWFVLYNVIGMLLAAMVATLQEAKIWKKTTKKKNVNVDDDLKPLNGMGYIKVFLFNLTWYIGCLLGSILISLKYVLTLGRYSDLGYDANRVVEAAVANFIIKVFVGKVQVEGQEHLLKNSIFHKNKPESTTTSPEKATTTQPAAPIFVANHCSQLDVAAVYRVLDNVTSNMRFKWIAKYSVLYLPGVGPLMWLGDHVLIQRRSSSSSKNNKASKDSRNTNASVAQLFAKSNKALQNGTAMFLFPQGTRRMTSGDTSKGNDDAHLPFKDGAFIMAEDNQSPLIPISIIIPRDNSCWNSWYPFTGIASSSAVPTIRLVIHEPVLPSSTAKSGKATPRSKEELKQLCYDAIYSALPSVARKETAKNK